jgi:hypothetical protein
MTHLVWKDHKSQLWIIGFLQLFHIGGVYIRVVSSTVFNNSWITILILTWDSYRDKFNEPSNGSETWTLLLATSWLPACSMFNPHPHHKDFSAGYRFHVWGASTPLSCHQDISRIPRHSLTHCTSTVQTHLITYTWTVRAVCIWWSCINLTARRAGSQDQLSELTSLTLAWNPLIS